MAVARVTLVCPECGKEFEVRKACRNTREAESYEAWVAKQGWVCSECAEAATAAVAEKAIAKFGMPEITGKSDKQIKYANDLRNKFISNRCDDLAYRYLCELKSTLANSKFFPAIAKRAEKYGNSEAFEVYDFLDSIQMVTIIILTNTADAHTIIGLLTSQFSLDKRIEMVNAAVEALAAAKAEAEATEEGNDNNAAEETTAESTAETKKTSYDKSAIMRSAWAKYKAKGNKKTFSECLKAAWAEAKKAAGVETTTTKRTATTTTEKTTKTTRRTSKTSTAVYAG